jgi:UDP-glucose 4-epimerase
VPNVLVTGGAGFIGSNIVDKCIEQGLKVVVVDDMSHGKPDNLNPEAEFYKIDIGSKGLAKLLESRKIEYVIHQAAQVDVQTSLKDPKRDATINILGTLNLLEACRMAGVKKIVYPSSAAIYGNPQYLPVDEKHPLSPQSGYGVSKYVPEKYLAVYKDLYGLDYTVLRYANVYGPKQDASGEGGVVAIFIDKLLKGEIPVIYGDGEQTRDFVFVGDVARANLMALKKGSGEVMNVSTGKGISVNELFYIIADLLGNKEKPIYAPSRPGDLRESYLSNNLIQKVLGWKPYVGLKEGIEITLRYQQNLYSSKLKASIS